MTERKTPAERQRAYTARMKEAGFRRLSVWVPLSHKNDFDRAIIDLQIQWEREGLYPSSGGD